MSNFRALSHYLCSVLVDIFARAFAYFYAQICAAIFCKGNLLHFGSRIRYMFIIGGPSIDSFCSIYYTLFQPKLVIRSVCECRKWKQILCLHNHKDMHCKRNVCSFILYLHMNKVTKHKNLSGYTL